MNLPKSLYKTTIVIWSDFDPSGCEIDDLAREAVNGDSYCESREDEVVTDPTKFPQTEFFGWDGPDDYDDEDCDDNLAVVFG